MRRLVLLLVGALVLLPALPAHAETWSAKDRRADVRVQRGAFDDCTPELRRDRSDRRHDVLGLAIDHSADTVTLQATMRQLPRRDRSGTTFGFRIATGATSYDLDVVRDRRGGLQTDLTETPDQPDPETLDGCVFGYYTTAIECPGLAATADPVTDTLSVSVPRGCLGDPRWVRAGLHVYSFSGEVTGARLVTRSDTWSRHGAERNGFTPPLSPRVTRG